LKVAIVGSREYPRLDMVWDFITKQAARRPDTVIISGGARGVDTVAAVAGRMAGLQVLEIIPDWDGAGMEAGFLRNSEIVAQVESVVAFWDGSSRGTRDTIEKARSEGKKVLVLLPTR
jgi:YspA, cpYpsA-related SLOG family